MTHSASRQTTIGDRRENESSRACSRRSSHSAWKPTAAWSASNSTTSRSRRVCHQGALRRRGSPGARWIGANRAPNGRRAPTAPGVPLAARSRRRTGTTLVLLRAILENLGGFDTSFTIGLPERGGRRVRQPQNLQRARRTGLQGSDQQERLPAPGRPPPGSSRTPTPGTAAPSRNSPMAMMAR